MRCSLCAASIVVLGCLVLTGCEGPASSPPPAATAPAPTETPAPLPGEGTPGEGSPVTITPAAKAALVAPVLDDQTVAIGFLDVKQLDPTALLAESKRLQESSGAPKPSAEEEQKNAALAQEIKQQIEHVFCIISLNDVPARSPFTAFKLASGADPKRVFAFTQTGKFDSPVDQAKFDTLSFTKGELFVVGGEPTILRLKGQESSASFPHLEQALQVGGDSPAQFIFMPSDSAREPLTRMMALLPPPLKTEGPNLVSAIRHAVLAFDAPPAVQLKFQVQAQDASGAERLQQALQMGLDGLKLAPNLLPEMRDLLSAISPQVSGEQISLSMKQGDAAFDNLSKLLTKAASSAGEVAALEQSRANMKALALAMHTYADRNGKLPAAYSSKNSQPLLSWRVHLLPFLGQQALYEQFKLDEPWDSEHNKALISQMPAAYALPGSNPTTGLTPFLVPRGDDMIFEGDKGIGFVDITDGTSNTMLMIDAGPDKAVIWTKPEDWQIDIDAPLAGLPPRFNTMMCDGATRPFTNTVDPEKFLYLLVRNDGQVVDADQLAYSAGGPAGGAPFSLPSFSLTPPPTPETAMPGGYGERGESPPGGISSDGRPVPPKAESIFITQAKKAFSEGRDKEGFDYLYAEVVAGEDKDGLRKMVRWFDNAKRPAMAIRWGIGINYTAPSNYNGPPSPVGRIVTGQGGGGGGGGGGDASSAPQVGAAPAAVLDYFTAELGTKLLDGLRSRTDQGQFGEVLSVIANTPGVTSNTNNSGNMGEGSGAGAANNKSTEFKAQSLIPGVVFVGVGKDKDLLARAKKEELDALVIFTIKVEPQPRVVINTTKLSLFELNKGTKLGDSKQIKATVVEVFRKENEKGIDPVEDMMQKFFVLVDASFKMGDLPTSATPDKMLAHANKLAESEPENKLPIMVAIAFYQDKGSLSKDDIAAAYGKLTDEATGKRLVGTIVGRKRAMAALLPKVPEAAVGVDGQPGAAPPKRLGLGGSTEGNPGERGP